LVLRLALASAAAVMLSGPVGAAAPGSGAGDAGAAGSVVAAAG